MSEDKPKTSTPLLLLAGFAAVTSVGDAARSYFERNGDVEAAKKEAADRVTVDQSIQAETLAAFVEVHEILEEQDEILEEQDRAIWELERELDRVLDEVPPPDNGAGYGMPDPPAHEEPKPRKRKHRPAAKPTLDFAEPEPAYDIREQLEQRALPALPPLPKPPGK
jgi:hypothetical protein